jgi:hypothetical protein
MPTPVFCASGQIIATVDSEKSLVDVYCAPFPRMFAVDVLAGRGSLRRELGI